MWCALVTLGNVESLGLSILLSDLSMSRIGASPTWFVGDEPGNASEPNRNSSTSAQLHELYKRLWPSPLPVTPEITKS